MLPFTPEGDEITVRQESDPSEELTDALDEVSSWVKEIGIDGLQTRVRSHSDGKYWAILLEVGKPSWGLPHFRWDDLGDAEVIGWDVHGSELDLVAHRWSAKPSIAYVASYDIEDILIVAIRRAIARSLRGRHLAPCTGWRTSR